MTMTTRPNVIDPPASAMQLASSDAASSDVALSAARASDAASSGATAPTRTKRDSVLALLRRTKGASLDEMVAATGWLPHTARAMLTGLRKTGYGLSSEKADGVRRYRVGADAGAGKR